MSSETLYSQFGGLKDDTDPKQTPAEFFTEATNWNFPTTGTPGLEMILMPNLINTIGVSAIDGLFEYRYLDANNVLQTEQICVTNGFIFKNALSPHPAVAVTFTAGATNTVNKNGHSFVNGNGVYFNGGTLPSGITANTLYYVINKATNTFQISTNLGGGVLSLTTNGSGTMYAYAVPELLKSGLTAGRCSFVTYQDKLFICNGVNYPQVYEGQLGIVHEMGSPAVKIVASAGIIDAGNHYYAMTYLTVGGEEVLGTVSNTIAVPAGSQQATLNLPLGYDGVLTRKVYRTLAGGTTLKLLTTISDNTTLTFTDNVADATITGNATIPATNNEMIKPYAITVAVQKLYAGKVAKYPTQVFTTPTNYEVIDPANGLDLANYGDDNTPITALTFDYNKIIVGTQKNIIFVDPATGDVVRSRGNVGIKDGYSCKIVPAYADFAGGLIFVSSMNDVRLLTGTQATAVFQTLDNIRTDTVSQNIRGSLNTLLASYTNLTAEFFDYRYHLAIDNIKYVFDIRTKGWTKHSIKTTSYESKPRCFAVMGTTLKLYSGQSDGTIEQEYVNIQYKGEDVTATLTIPLINASRMYNWLDKFAFWVKTSSQSVTSISVTLDSNTPYAIVGSLTLYGGIYNAKYFNSTYFQSVGKAESIYRVLNINNPCKWASWSLSITSGNIQLLQWAMVGTALENEERE